MSIQIIINDELELHPLHTEDATDLFYSIDNQREYLGRWLSFVPYTKELTDSKQYINSILNASEEDYEHVFTIRHKDNFAGMIGFVNSSHQHKKTEIGYWLSESYQHKGIMTTAVRAVCKFAFEVLHFNRIQIKCAVGNLPSSNIPKRIGFSFEGIERQGEKFADGSFKDLEIYSLLREEFKI